MEVTIMSRDYVKPSKLVNGSLKLKPYKLCLFDQLTPMTYPSGVTFYADAIKRQDRDHERRSSNLMQTLARLKEALSRALDLYYPFSGRLRDNMYIDDFDAGLLYLEARVNCRMSEYFKLGNTESLTEFVAFHPFVKEKDVESLPQVAFQVNVFSCGGVNIGISLGHKFADGVTVTYLLKTWAALFSNSPEKVIRPNLEGGSLAFPPRQELPQSHHDLMDEMWFKQANCVTRRFTFDTKAIASLRAKARSERVPKPSRNEALSAFIWQHVTAASLAVSDTPRLSIAAHAVNLRPRTQKPFSLEGSVGNLFWWAFAAANPASDSESELSQLTAQLKDALDGFDNEFLDSLRGEEGFEAVSELLAQIESMFDMEAEKPHILAFTGWNGLFNDIDFGWGKPYWMAVMGKVGPAFRNLVVFVDTAWGRGIEAWITLEEKQMRVLERNKEFLAFGPLNPGVSSL